jgi:hypothetical protein
MNSCGSEVGVMSLQQSRKCDFDFQNWNRPVKLRVERGRARVCGGNFVAKLYFCLLTSHLLTAVFNKLLQPFCFMC